MNLSGKTRELFQLLRGNRTDVARTAGLLRGLFLAVFLIIYSLLQAQVDTLRLSDPLIIRDSSKVVVLLDEIALTPLPDFNGYEDRMAYYTLRRRVLKVYPYAAVGRDTLSSVETRNADIRRRRAKKKMAKEVEHSMRAIFEEELRKLTRSEGQILMKLIYRETGETAYSITRRIRGGLSAVFYQTMAKIYDSDMKSTYDPQTVQEDAWIENILQRAFASGTLQR